MQDFGYRARAPTILGGAGRPLNGCSRQRPDMWGLSLCASLFTGQGRAKVSDYRFIHKLLTRYTVCIYYDCAGRVEASARRLLYINMPKFNCDALKIVRLRFSAWTALQSARWVAS